MPNYLNTNKPFSLFKEAVSMTYFVDKSGILEELIPLLGTGSKYLCITRPRRFGKTIMANLIASFFSKGISGGTIFERLQIMKNDHYYTYLNQHNVIYIDFSELPYPCESYHDYVDHISTNLVEDLARAYPNCEIKAEAGPWAALDRVFSNTGEKFIFVMDEWDSMFHNPAFAKENQKDFLLFLKSMFKSKAYVEFVYMTGVLPIAKYSSGSELNMFDEYNMASSPKYSNYFGFTEKEVNNLFAKYISETLSPQIDFEELREWYNGYQTAGAEDAIEQIKTKNYALKLKNKFNPELKYSGRILAVGMGYDKKSKNHECVVEVLE